MSNFKKARESKGLSQKEIAITLNVSQPTVSEWESGKKTPAGKNMKRLLEILGCSSDYLLGVTDIPSPPDAKKEAPSVESTEEALKVIAYNAFGPNPTQEQLDSLGLAVHIAIEHAKNNREKFLRGDI